MRIVGLLSRISWDSLVNFASCGHLNFDHVSDVIFHDFEIFPSLLDGFMEDSKYGIMQD